MSTHTDCFRHVFDSAINGHSQADDDGADIVINSYVLLWLLWLFILQ